MQNLVKYRKVSKYYFLLLFIVLFMFLLRVKLFKTSHISASSFLIFLENALKEIWNSFNTMFQPQREDWENITKKDKF